MERHRLVMAMDTHRRLGMVLHLLVMAHRHQATLEHGGLHRGEIVDVIETRRMTRRRAMAKVRSKAKTTEEAIRSRTWSSRAV
jgi:hypothetical protein